MSDDDDRIPMGLEPFDLQAPARLLHPRFSAMGERAQITDLKLGSDSDQVKLKRYHYKDGTTSWTMEVLCDKMPHCDSCECGNYHHINISAAQVQQLKQFLGP